MKLQKTLTTISQETTFILQVKSNRQEQKRKQKKFRSQQMNKYIKMHATRIVENNTQVALKPDLQKEPHKQLSTCTFPWIFWRVSTFLEDFNVQKNKTWVWAKASFFSGLFINKVISADEYYSWSISCVLIGSFMKSSKAPFGQIFFRGFSSKKSSVYLSKLVSYSFFEEILCTLHYRLFIF